MISTTTASPAELRRRIAHDERFATVRAHGSHTSRAGVKHAFANESEHPVRFLNFSTPAGFEGYTRELGAAFANGSARTSADIGRIASRYDFRPA